MIDLQYFKIVFKTRSLFLNIIMNTGLNLIEIKSLN